MAGRAPGKEIPAAWHDFGTVCPSFHVLLALPSKGSWLIPPGMVPPQQHLIQKWGEYLKALWEKVSQHSEGRNGRREQLRSWNATLWKGLVSHNPPEIEANSIQQPDSSSPSYPTQPRGFIPFPPKREPKVWGAQHPQVCGHCLPPGFQGHSHSWRILVAPTVQGIFGTAPGLI